MPDSQCSSYLVPAARRETDGVRLEIKKSEFIAYVHRVESESAAREVIERIRKHHHGARHVCSAFILGPDRTVQRCCDDGEPAGTAGIPMLQALYSFTHPQFDGYLSDTVVAVVRYFGGIKLGAGGLVRAYTDAVVAGLESTVVRRRARVLLYEVAAPHADAGRWENELRATGVEVFGTNYGGTSAHIQLGIRDERGAVEKLQTDLATITSGAAHPVATGTQWMDISS
ncbi:MULTISPECIES: IMPACT family protein [Auritidibacter]|uniref:IMPACT family protein n=1 Tax=Auritidibacter ignavus TaxID=678932 RepID=A0AAJ6DDB2_9MICC|nr:MULTISPECIES: YigZ family protein [Auritidibacter]PXA77743.1 YigZ family protein [Auritidibacter sp. NML100628]WGH93642.1 IMPACT family protein [Auritidibacter ignavus]